MFHEQELRDLHQRVRDKLKAGALDDFTKGDADEIDRLVRRGSARSAFDVDSLQEAFFRLQLYLKRNWEELESEAKHRPSYLKSLTVSFELRDYLGELPTEEWRLLSDKAQGFLEEVVRHSRMPATANEVELLKEKVRLISVYANQLYRNNDFTRAGLIIQDLKAVIETKLRPRSKCQTILGGLSYLEGKLHRHQGDYRAAERCFAESIEYYQLWLTDNGHDQRNVRLASYKNAMSLGNIAWCKNMRGFCTDALSMIDIARLLNAPTDLKLNKAHLNLIYADIKRTFIGSSREQLKEVITIAREAYGIFEKHPHGRMRSRAAFTVALLNYYYDDLPEAERKLDEVKEYSEAHQEERWIINYLLLLARIRNRQKSFSV